MGVMEGADESRERRGKVLGGAGDSDAREKCVVGRRVGELVADELELAVLPEQESGEVVMPVCVKVSAIWFLPVDERDR